MEAWYALAGMAFGYLSALIAAATLALSLRRLLADRALWRRVREGLPGAGAAATLQVTVPAGKRMHEGQAFPVPYEGTLGAALGCDVCLPNRRLHLRSAFFWMAEDGLHMVPLHKDGFLVDGAQVSPGDEAVLHEGSRLGIGEAELRLALPKRRRLERTDEPYVTRARRGWLKAGHGEGLGAPGKRERTWRKAKRKADAPDEKQDTPPAETPAKKGKHKP